jgi:glycosyltransferase involved in cell wall biosynthesis
MLGYFGDKVNCHVLYLIGELHTGGAERQLYYLLHAMDRERYRVAVAVWNYRDTDFHVQQIRNLNVPIYPVSDEHSSVRKLSAFRRLVKQSKPIIVHSYSFYTNIAVQWATLGTRTIPIGSIRSDFVWAMIQCGPVLGRLNARWPTNQICNSVSAARSVYDNQGFFVPRRLSVVQNGLDLEWFHNLAVPASNVPRLLGVGYLLPVKRWDRLLVAAQELARRGINFVLEIVGDGPLQPALEAQATELGISDRVNFLGHVDDIQPLLAVAAFVVHTADSEGCPNSVMEAMASGRAVVAVEAGDISTLIDHGNTGYIVAPGQQNMLIEYMQTLIQNPELCQSLGQAARRKAEQNFGLDRLLTDTLAVYRSLGWQDV